LMEPTTQLCGLSAPKVMRSCTVTMVIPAPLFLLVVETTN
jgi:hypothetical protein